MNIFIQCLQTLTTSLCMLSEEATSRYDAHDKENTTFLLVRQSLS